MQECDFASRTIDPRIIITQQAGPPQGGLHGRKEEALLGGESRLAHDIEAFSSRWSHNHRPGWDYFCRCTFGTEGSRR